MIEVRRDDVQLHPNAPTLLEYAFWPVLLIDQQHVVNASTAAVTLLGCDPSGLLVTDLAAHSPAELLDLLHLAVKMVDRHGSVLGSGVLRHQNGTLIVVELEAQPVVGRPGCAFIWIYPTSRMARRMQLLAAANRLAAQLLATQHRNALYECVILTLHQLGMIGTVVLIGSDGSVLPVAPPSCHLPFPFDSSQAALLSTLPTQSWPTLLEQIAAGQLVLLDSGSELRQQSTIHAAQYGQFDWVLPLMVASLGRESQQERLFVLCAPGLCSEDRPFVTVLVNYVLGALQQIELRDQMEAQIARLELIIRHIPDTLLAIRSDMTMTFLNEKPLRTGGYRREDIEGRLITDIVLPHQSIQLMRAWEGARHGEIQRLELELLRQDGTTMICAVTAGRLPGSDDVLVIITDMTVRQQLFQAEKMAALGRLVAGVAHELNNPMAVILGLVQLNLLDSWPTQLSDDLRSIEQATLRASRIVQQLTTFVQPHGARPLPIDLRQLLPEIAEKYRVQAATLDVQIVADVAADTPQIEGDVFQIQQVLINLFANALQAIDRQPEGSPRLIQVRSWGDGQRARMMVRDTGNGIAPALLSRIFEPFFTTRAVGQGVGLGLAIAYAIIQQHGGQIWAEHDLISGTVFHISLPAVRGVGSEQT